MADEQVRTTSGDSPHHHRLSRRCTFDASTLTHRTHEAAGFLRHVVAILVGGAFYTDRLVGTSRRAVACRPLIMRGTPAAPTVAFVLLND